MVKRLIIIRHAERPDIAEDTIGSDVCITENGVAASEKFARDIAGPIVTIRTSPILRCRQTAKVIAEVKEYSQNHITTSRLLGDPGFFIENANLAWQSWLNKGAATVNEHLINGTEKWPGFYDFDIAIKIIIKEITRELDSELEGTRIWVTHDTILATIASRVIDRPFTLNVWPTFLGYLSVTRDEKNILSFSYSHDASLCVN